MVTTPGEDGSEILHFASGVAEVEAAQADGRWDAAC
jgi:hypothetical protein